MLVYYEVVGGVFECLRLCEDFCDVCRHEHVQTVLIAGESTDYEFSAAIFIELLKFFCEVLINIFRMHTYVW